MALKPVKVKSLTLLTHPVKNPQGLVLPDKSPANVKIVIDGALQVDPIWFRKHQENLKKANGKVVLTVDLLVKTAGTLPNGEVILSVFAPRVPKLRIVEPVRLLTDPLTEDEKAFLVIPLADIVKEESEDG